MTEIAHWAFCVGLGGREEQMLPTRGCSVLEKLYLADRSFLYTNDAYLSERRNDFGCGIVNESGPHRLIYI